MNCRKLRCAGTIALWPHELNCPAVALPPCVGAGEAGAADIHIQQHLRPEALDYCPPSHAGARGYVNPAVLRSTSHLPSTPQISKYRQGMGDWHGQQQALMFA